MPTIYETLFKEHQHRQNKQTEMTLKDRIRSLNIVMYYLDRCGYCVQMKEMLKEFSDVILFKDASLPSTKEELRAYPQARGFPFFRSLTNGTYHLGKTKDVISLLESLSSV